MADSPTAPHPDLLALRAQIDGLDRELLALLNRRANLAQQVGELKKKEGSVVFRPERTSDEALFNAGKEHPEFARDGGKVTYMTFIDSTVYKPHLIEITFA